ncbi:MAG TPA: CRISPR-associated endonuclease Cas2 [Elusimicrobiales bacterium]|nr:CRISPR-associated endonuclease Cas2 [Elusimicrobiales bacterium]HOL62241.1 CRISPR-associated endonuclease Cas2 [Elusimicrobiales bacterium]HPO95419.1 CRISPR-associated endonuclease Cas2 [Elusimicrobiales bacterium]
MDRDKIEIFLETLALRILILLEAGIDISFKSANAKLKASLSLPYELKDAREEVITAKIRQLYKNKLIQKNSKGRYVLTSRGKKYIEKYRFNNLKLDIQKKKFEGKWSIVFFDIPETKRKLRNLFRKQIKLLGFYEIQKSVFVIPCVCEKEIDFLIDSYDLRKYVRYGILTKIDNELHLKRMFGLI